MFLGRAKPTSVSSGKLLMLSVYQFDPECGPAIPSHSCAHDRASIWASVLALATEGKVGQVALIERGADAHLRVVAKRPLTVVAAFKRSPLCQR
jgi:hypothetical protein